MDGWMYFFLTSSLIGSFWANKISSKIIQFKISVIPFLFFLLSIWSMYISSQFWAVWPSKEWLIWNSPSISSQQWKCVQTSRQQETWDHYWNCIFCKVVLAVFFSHQIRNMWKCFCISSSLAGVMPQACECRPSSNTGLPPAPQWAYPQRPVSLTLSLPFSLIKSWIADSVLLALS